MDEDLYGVKSCDVLGADLLNYYHRPVFNGGNVIIEAKEENDLSVLDPRETVINEKETKFTKSTQTDYRESESQTDPWDPPFKVVKHYKEPDVLQLRNFTYGNGLPASMEEISYIIETYKNKDLMEKLGNVIDNKVFKKKTEILCDQVKANWNYKIAVESQEQLKKLEIMKSSIIEELGKKSQKRELILKNLWNRKKEEMNKQNLKLEVKLNKELRDVENLYLTEKQNTIIPGEFEAFKDTVDRQNIKKGVLSNGNVDCLLKDYIVSNPERLSTVKNWLEKKQTILKNEVPLPILQKKTHREQLVEDAYQTILFKKRTKVPPKIYHRDYERGESVLPTVKPDDVPEFLDIDEKKIDLVTVWQKILRGLAYQKQMLELIDKHKDGLSISLPSVNLAINSQES